MTGVIVNGSANLAARKAASYTITGLKRWSVSGRELPAISQVKALHVYDFDNTLFMTPLPNPKLWTGLSLGRLQQPDFFVNGGWWHNQHILEATGEGVVREEPKAWEGWWNESIVSLVDLSLQQNDAITILLTGRSDKNFAEIITRMVASKKLPFHLICLRPQVGPNNQQFATTIKFKQALLEDLIYTFKDAEEIRVYEDRVNHVKAFRQFFESFNKMTLSPTAPNPRKPIVAEVIQVAEMTTNLDPVIEAAEIQRIINAHNATLRPGSLDFLEIRRSIFHTGYLISPSDRAKLLTLINLPPGVPQNEMKYLGDNILITPGSSSASKLERVGGIGREVTWRVTGVASYESKIWAARVSPVPSDTPFHTDNPVPYVVLAVLRGCRAIDAGRIQTWDYVPQDKQYIFKTAVGEKVQLAIEREDDGVSAMRDFKRRQRSPELLMQGDSYRPMASQVSRGAHVNDESRRFGTGGPNSHYRGGNQNRRGGGNGHAGGVQNRYPARASRGVGGAGAGRGGGGGRGRGRGGYRSLDDVIPGSSRYGGQGSAYQNSQQPNYDDGPSYGAGSREIHSTAHPL